MPKKRRGPLGRRVSTVFNLGKSQAELDFVDVVVGRDLPFFVDPFAISQQSDPWSIGCHQVLVAYFQRLVDCIRDQQPAEVRELLAHLGEPNETRFGLSKGRPRGNGIGIDQADTLREALASSTAVQTGFINTLEECELMIPGISADKISDLTTNILRLPLAEYTRDQCQLLGIPMEEVPVTFYDANAARWTSDYKVLPVIGNLPLLLVPKRAARYRPLYNHRQYYQHFVLNYLQAEHLRAGSSLVRTLRNGARVVRKKDVARVFRCTKENIVKFSRDHPGVLEKYRATLATIAKRPAESLVSLEEEKALAGSLSEVLRATGDGSVHASAYHRAMIGILEFLFWPSLLHPKKEKEIHDGRKRIDILMDNGAEDGVFLDLHRTRKLPCAFVPIECKNYTTDVANPELDQLSGRFALNRGKVGILCCRRFEDRALFVRRCQDTLRDDRGLIVPLDDERVLTMLGLVEAGERAEVDRVFREYVNEVWVN